MTGWSTGNKHTPGKRVLLSKSCWKAAVAAERLKLFALSDRAQGRGSPHKVAATCLKTHLTEKVPGYWGQAFLHMHIHDQTYQCLDWYRKRVHLCCYCLFCQLHGKVGPSNLELAAKKVVPVPAGIEEKHFTGAWWQRQLTFVRETFLNNYVI